MDINTENLGNIFSNLKIKKSYLILGGVVLFILFLIILTYLLITSPFILLAYVFYKFFDTLNSMHKRNKNYKFDIKNLENK